MNCNAANNFSKECIDNIVDKDYNLIGRYKILRNRKCTLDSPNTDSPLKVYSGTVYK